MEGAIVSRAMGLRLSLGRFGLALLVALPFMLGYLVGLVERIVRLVAAAAIEGYLRGRTM